MENSKTPKPTEMQREHEIYCSLVINKIAAAATVELSTATLAVYLESLIELTNEQLARTQYRTIEDWAEPSKMPPIPFIKARAHREPGDELEARSEEILQRPDKPADWRQIATEPALDRFAPKGVTQEEISGWLEGGKQKWRDQCAAMGLTPDGQPIGKLETYQRNCESLARSRNGPSMIPADPQERKKWHHALYEKRKAEGTL